MIWVVGVWVFGDVGDGALVTYRMVWIDSDAGTPVACNVGGVGGMDDVGGVGGGWSAVWCLVVGIAWRATGRRSKLYDQDNGRTSEAEQWRRRRGAGEGRRRR